MLAGSVYPSVVDHSAAVPCNLGLWQHRQACRKYRPDRKVLSPAAGGLTCRLYRPRDTPT